MSVKAWIISAGAVILLGAGGGYYYVHQQSQPASQNAKVGQMNTKNVDRKRQEEKNLKKQVETKKYQIPKVQNKAQSSITSIAALPKDVSAHLNQGLVQTFAYLSSPESLAAKGNYDVVPSAFKLSQYYANADVLTNGLSLFNQTSNKPKQYFGQSDGKGDNKQKVISLPAPGDLYQLDTFAAKNVKKKTSGNQTVYSLDYDLTYSVKNGQFKYHLTGSMTLDQAGKIKSITGQTAQN